MWHDCLSHEVTGSVQAVLYSSDLECIRATSNEKAEPSWAKAELQADFNFQAQRAG